MLHHLPSCIITLLPWLVLGTEPATPLLPFFATSPVTTPAPALDPLPALGASVTTEDVLYVWTR